MMCQFYIWSFQDQILKFKKGSMTKSTTKKKKKKEHKFSVVSVLTEGSREFLRTSPLVVNILRS